MIPGEQEILLTPPMPCGQGWALRATVLEQDLGLRKLTKRLPQSSVWLATLPSHSRVWKTSSVSADYPVWMCEPSKESSFYTKAPTTSSLASPSLSLEVRDVETISEYPHILSINKSINKEIKGERPKLIRALFLGVSFLAWASDVLALLLHSTFITVL